MSDERQLVARMLAGDEDAFSAFFDSSFQPLFRFALARVDGDEDLAEEVVQETLCIAVEKIAGWRGEARLLTWLCTICRHQISAHFRRLGRRPAAIQLHDERPEIRAALDSLRHPTDDPEQVTARRELANLVHQALDSLPPHQARALEWKYLAGDSMQEIAARTGSTAKAVESLLTRARHAYRDALEALLQGFSQVEGRRRA